MDLGLRMASIVTSYCYSDYCFEDLGAVDKRACFKELGCCS